MIKVKTEAHKKEISDVLAHQVETSTETMIQTEAGQQEGNDYVSSAPKINNAGLIMAGLSAFGGV